MWPVKWEKQTTGDSYVDASESSVLDLKSFDQNDYGNYRCSSKNNAGMAEIKLQINANTFTTTDSVFKSNTRVAHKHLAHHHTPVNARKNLISSGGGGLEMRKNRFKQRKSKLKKSLVSSNKNA